MKFFSLVITVFALTYIALSSISSVNAAGYTSGDNNPGQVKTTSKDGTIYLTTRVNEGQQTATATAKKSSTHTSTGGAIDEPITQPEGFAADLGSYINAVLSLVIVVSLLLVFFYFILAGIQWITSGGDKGKTEEARNKIVHASIGILVVSSSFALVGFVAYILGFESFNEALASIKPITSS